MFAISLGAQSLVYLTSPALALIADNELTRTDSGESNKKPIPVGAS